MESKWYHLLPDRYRQIFYALATYWAKAAAHNEAEGPSVLKPTEKDLL